MIPDMLLEEFEKQGAKYKWDGKAMHAIDPPQMGFGYLCFSHMVPPFKPEHTLMLGYGDGIVPELMRKIWGQCKITGVDNNKQDYTYTEYKMKIMDAQDYLKEATDLIIDRYDYICVDLFDGAGILSFLKKRDFAVTLKKMAKKLVCINCLQTDMKELNANMLSTGFMLDRGVPVEANCVLWYSVRDEEKIAA